MLEEQVFDFRVHDRAAFHCGVQTLDVYLHKYAAQQNSKGISTVFVLVDAKDEKAKSFYERYGFIPCADAPLTLYLPLG